MKLGETATCAAQLVSKDRQEEYGDPLTVYGRAADIAGALIGRAFVMQDIILVMIAVKLARESVVHKSDNLVDLAGYADILNSMREGQG